MFKMRLMRDTLAEYLTIFKAVSLVGPKHCGKTTLAEQFKKSELIFTPSNANNYKLMIQHEIGSLLDGPYPKLVDEWQLVPIIWDEIRHKVDKLFGTGYFVLTGSSAANLSKNSHSGQGRIAPLKIRPMSLFESEVSLGSVSLQSLFDGNKFRASQNTVTIYDYALWIIKGGWPTSMKHNERSAIISMRAYLDNLCTDDVNRVSEKKYNSLRVRKTIQSIARFVGSEAPNTSLAADLSEVGNPISPNTLADYLDVLAKLYITEDLHSWNPNLRSSVTIKTTPARFFVDPSIGAAALNFTTNKLLNDFETFGLYFENLAVRDIRIYAESIHGEVYRYKDSKNNEIDIIVKLADGRWGAVEVKMGSDKFDTAAKKLMKFAENVDHTKDGRPSFLAIVTSHNLSYQRADGVYVISLGSLKN